MDQKKHAGRCGMFALHAALLSLLCLCCSLALALAVHLPSRGDAALPRGRDLASAFEAGALNVKSGALDGLTYIPKIYRIPENDLTAPPPNPANFGKTTDPAVIREVIDKASELLDGQNTVWNENVQLFPGAEYTFYYDETILVIAWRERVLGKSCTFAEVRIADGSQLRRALAGNSYDSPSREYCSRLASDANAVVATNGDFYSFRPLGITVYQRQLYRFENELVDTCFFTAGGDMLPVHRNTFQTREEAEQFVRDNDVVFSVAFGPIVVENGELLKYKSYRVGQIFEDHSRSIIGQTGKLHYLLMTIKIEGGGGVPAKLWEASQIMHDKGCIQAYTLDGGQTAELWMGGQILNNIDWSAERQVSDIIYFATALPSDGGNSE